MMKIAILGSALALAMTTASFAQTTGPAGQQDTNKPGMANPNAPSTMSTDGMRKSTGTTGSAMTGTTTPGSTTGPAGQTSKPDTK